MGFFSHLLGWADLFNKTWLDEHFPDSGYGDAFGWMSQVFGPISIVLWVILGLVGAAGAIYAIYVGIQLARADEQGKRDEAKKHLITLFIAIAVTIALIVFFNELMPTILSAILIK